MMTHPTATAARIPTTLVEMIRGVDLVGHDASDDGPMHRQRQGRVQRVIHLAAEGLHRIGPKQPGLVDEADDVGVDGAFAGGVIDAHRQREQQHGGDDDPPPQATPGCTAIYVHWSSLYHSCFPLQRVARFAYPQAMETFFG